MTQVRKNTDITRILARATAESENLRKEALRPAIPTDTPATGKDIVALKTVRNPNLDTNDVMWMLGLNNNYYSRAVSKALTKEQKKNGETTPGRFAPIPDITRATLVRFLTTYPKYIPVPAAPSASDLFELIRSAKGFEEFSKADFGILFGNEPSAGFRWLQNNGGSIAQRDGRSKVVRQTMTLVYDLIVDCDPAERAEFLARWMSVLITEAKTRGVTVEDMTSGAVFSTRAKKGEAKRRPVKLRGSGIWAKVAGYPTH